MGHNVPEETNMSKNVNVKECVSFYYSQITDNRLVRGQRLCYALCFKTWSGFKSLVV